ncbi:hypothetical protein A3Q56_04985 [Intoshia linei]|uniref:Uncharacterized protein n=1 Tax=Intoshia linei TaxID=1819745 RepID=A0A177B1J8_9BILA|nr:hypothetical protein A3Q56_04985 [Intoshia linei]
MWSVSLTKLPSQFTNNANEIDELNQYTYLVVSLNTTTLILENDDDMFQVEGTNFVCDDKTISIIQPSEVNFQTDEQITPSMIAIQVLPHSIEMVTSSSVDKLAKLGRDNRDEVYTIAKTCKKYLTVLTSQNLLYIFEICCNIEENTDYINQNISDKYQDTNSDVDANLNVKGDCELNIETMERISEISESDQPVETSEIDTENLECKPISTLKSVIFTLIPHYLIDSEPGVNYIEDIVLFNVLFDTHSIFKISWTDRNVSNDCQLDSSKIDTGENVDDEEFMLYGASNEMSSQSKVMKLQIAEENENDDTIHEKMTNSQYLLFKIGKNGHFEILELLTRQPLFSVEKFYNMPIVLNDDFDKLNPTIVSNFTWLPDRNIYGIDDFHVLFTKDSDPIIYFIVLINSQIVVYKSIQFSNAKQERLNMRFVKCNLNINLQKSPGAKEGKDSPQKIVYFDDISDSYGVFITGLYPCFMFFKDDGFIYFHPMTVDGPVDFMAPFSSGVCRKGFVYVNLNHQIRISMLDDTFNYNCEWAVKNIDIYSTPRFLLYHRKTNIIGVVSSKQQDCMKLVRYTFEGDKETVEIPVDDRFVQPQVDIFQIELYTSDTGEKIPNSLHIFDLFDHILCAKEANLLYEGAHSGVKPYFTLGSNVCNGEEVTSRGRIYVMDVIEVVPEVDQPLTKYKLKIEYAEDQKGPITAIHHVNGYLVTAIGQKIYIWQYSDQDLSGVSFIDTTIYIVNISVISNLVLVADVYMSVNLLRFDSDKRVISQVCKDTRDLSIYATGFIVNDDKLAFIATDDKCNLFIYEYLPEAVESVGGTRLVCSSAVNIGLHVTNFVHVQCKRYDSTLVKFVTDSKPSLRHATYYSATDGSIGCILPISEKCYRRLLMLQNILKLHLSNIGNVNHGFYRKVIIPEIQIHRLNFRTIIDVNYLKTYMYMSFSERCEFASRIGTTMSQIIEDLTEIDRFSDHF